MLSLNFHLRSINQMALKHLHYFLTITLLMFAGFADADDLFAEQTLRIGFHGASFHEYSREDLEVSVKIVTEEMGKAIGLETNVVIYEDMKLMLTDFEKGRINLIFASPLLIATGINNDLLADGFKFMPSGGNGDSLVILTKKNAGMDHFNSLRGKRLGLAESDPVSDLYVNFLAQSTFKKDSQQVFKKISHDKRSHLVILKLFFDQVDVACVHENFFAITGELNPQILSTIQIIDRIGGIPPGPGFFHKKVDPAFRERVIAEVIKMDTYPRGQQFLEIFKTEKALRATPAELDTIKQLYKDYQHLRKINGR